MIAKPNLAASRLTVLLLSLCLLTMCLGAATPDPHACTARPTVLHQGEVIHVVCPAWDTLKAGEENIRMNRRIVRLFVQSDGTQLGLMPVPVLEKSGSYSLDVIDQGDAPRQSIEIKVLDAHYQKQNVTIERAVAALKPSPDEQESVNAFRQELLPTRYWEDRMQLPVPGCLTSRFGVQRYLNGRATGDFHAGLDQRGAAGTPIRAIADGDVKLVRNFNLRGGTVALDHGQGVESIYLHMSKTTAKEGEHIAAGDIIGYIGATGRANGPHLHWTLYVNGVPVNPSQWMTVPPACAVGGKGPLLGTQRLAR